MSGFYYLASPYLKYEQGSEAAHRDVCVQAALLIKAGVPVYSPIAHTHSIALHGRLDPFDHAIWLPADQPMIDAAKGLIVLQLDGWDISYGIGYEIMEFKLAGKPIIFMAPNVIPAELRKPDDVQAS